MQKSSLQEVLKTLTDAKVKFAVVGGLAVNLYGYQRFTRDIDIIVSLAKEDLESFIGALECLEFRPIYPVPLADFLIDEKRSEWNRERHMEVFSVVSDLHPTVTLDVFVNPLYRYEEIECDMVMHKITEDLSIPVIDLQRLICMKESVGRPQDLLDVEKLKILLDEQS